MKRKGNWSNQDTASKKSRSEVKKSNEMNNGQNDEKTKYKYNLALPTEIRDHIFDESNQWIDSINQMLNQVKQTNDYDTAHVALRSLNSYLDISYPISSEMRAKLIHSLYTLIVDTENILNYHMRTKAVRLVSKLVREKYNIEQHLKLPWKQLFDLTKTYFDALSSRGAPVVRVSYPSLAIMVSRIRNFFGIESAESILNEVRPRLCPHDQASHQYASMMSLFLPTKGYQDEPAWLEELMTTWGWVTVYPSWDLYFLLIFSKLAKDSCGAVEWDKYLSLIFTHLLRIIDLPVGNPPPQSLYGCEATEDAILFTSIDGIQDTLISNVASLIVWMIKPGSQVLSYLRTFMQSIESFYHPLNGGEWSRSLGLFLFTLTEKFALRLREEDRDSDRIPKQYRVVQTEACREFVEIICPIAIMAMYSKTSSLREFSIQAIRHLAHIAPEDVFPDLMKRCAHALQTLTETHQTVAAIECLAVLVAPLLRDNYPDGIQYLPDILNATLPGLDLNDMVKTHTTLKFYSCLFSSIPIEDRSMNNGTHEIFPEFGEWSSQFLDRLFTLVSHQNVPPRHNQSSSSSGSGDELAQRIFWETVHLFFMQLSDDLYEVCSNKVCNFLQNEFLPYAQKPVGDIVAAVVLAKPEATLKKFVDFCYDRLIIATSNSWENLTKVEATWFLYILSQAVWRAGSHVLQFKDKIMEMLRFAWKSDEKQVIKATGKLCRNLLRCLTMNYPTEGRSANPELWNSDEFWKNQERYWGRFPAKKDLHVQWHIPNKEELDFAILIYNESLAPVVEKLDELTQNDQSLKDIVNGGDKLIHYLRRLRYSVRGASLLLPEIEDDTAETFQDERFLPGNKIHSGIALNLLNQEQKQNIRFDRASVLQLLHSLITALMRNHEDQPKIIKNIVKLILPIICTREISWEQVQNMQDSYAYTKLTIYRSYIENAVPRYLQIRQVEALNTFRWAMHSNLIPYCSIHKTILNDLLKMSLSSYSEVRKKSQLVFVKVAQLFPSRVIDPFIPTLISKLSDKQAKDEERTGAIYLMQSEILLGRIITNWKHMANLFVSLTRTQHIETQTVDARVSELFEIVSESFSVLPLSIPPGTEENEHTYFNLLDQLHSIVESKASRTIVTQTKERSNSSNQPTTMQIEENSQNKSQPNSSTVTSSTTSSTAAVPWKCKYMACLMLGLLIRRDRPFPIKIAVSMVKALKSDIELIRDVAIETFNIILGIYKPIQPRKKIHIREKRWPLSHFDDWEVPQTRREWEQTLFFEKNFFGWNKCITMPNVYVYDPEEKEEIQAKTTDRFASERKQFQEELRKMFLDKEFSSSLLNIFFIHDDRFRDDIAQLWKGLFQMLGEDLIHAVLPSVKEAVRKYVGSASPEERGVMSGVGEFIGGLIRATKHWNFDAVQRANDICWDVLDEALYKCSADSVDSWMEALQFSVYDKDVRRVAWLRDKLRSRIFMQTGTSSSISRALRYLLSVLGEFSWRDTKNHTELLHFLSDHIAYPYQQVRETIGGLVSMLFQVGWDTARHPETQLPMLEGPSATADEPYKQELNQFVHKLETKLLDSQPQQHEKESKPSQPKQSIQSMDTRQSSTASQDSSSSSSSISVNMNDERTRIGKTILDLISGMFTAGSALSGIPFASSYVPKLLPLLCQIIARNTEEEIQTACKDALAGMSVSAFTPESAAETMAALKQTAESSSWRARCATLTFLQSFGFRHQFYIKRDDILNLALHLLEDSQVEVRELANQTIAGFISMSYDHKPLVADLMHKFKQWARIPVSRKSSSSQIASKHSGILGLSALISAFPYDIPDFMPEVLVQLSRHASDPAPIMTTVRHTFREFWKTHRDMWPIHKERFTEEQLLVLRDLLISPTYFA
eukprot:gb/GECH01004798.1/.p1 GENE.gb/GECH01004798.1/~~gb/GECH01004798.1/.p1  ORF type:complete len:1870 (+),score=407.61 gb/GECH01004798.1/:1-5610(+)